jgi:putative copper export protein
MRRCWRPLGRVRSARCCCRCWRDFLQVRSRLSLARSSPFARARQRPFWSALGLRALTQTATVFGWSAVLSWDAVRVAAIESRWGSAWHLQVAAASIFLAASTWVGRGRPGLRAGGSVATIACIALCYSIPLLGHGASSRWRVLLHGTHILGAGVWAGTLIALMLMRVSSARRFTLLRGVSPLALSGAAVMGLAGVVMAWSYLGSVSNLWATTYGQLLVLKLAVVCCAAACGFVNWRRFARRRAPQGPAERTSRASGDRSRARGCRGRRDSGLDRSRASVEVFCV